MSNIDFSNVTQTPDNVTAITGNELLFGAPNRSTPPKVYKFPFTTSGVTTPIVSFAGIVAGRNNFTVTDGTVTNIKVSGDLIGFGTASPDALVTVVKDGAYSNNMMTLKNASDVSTQASIVAISYGTSTLVNGRLSVFNNAFVDVGAMRKNSMNIDSDGAKGISLSASNAVGYASIYTGGTATTNERIRVFASGNVSIGFTTYTDNGYNLEINGTLKATTITGAVDWANLTFGITPVVPAPAINTNTTQVATTAFVQSRSRAFKFNAGVQVSTNTTLAATDNGKWFNVTANVTVTLPTLASVTDGITFFVRSGNTAWTISAATGELINGASPALTRTMQPFEIIEVVHDAGSWNVIKSSFDRITDKFSPLANPIFDSNAGANGETDINFATGAVKRFYNSITGTAGATYSLQYCDNSGVLIGAVHSVDRSTGTTTFTTPVVLNTATGVTKSVGTNTNDLATTAHVYASVSAGAVAPRDGKLGRVLTELDGVTSTWQPLYGALSVKTAGWTAVVGGNYGYKPTASSTVNLPTAGLVADDLIRISDILGNCLIFPLTINFGSVNFRGALQSLVINISNATCFFRYVDSTIGWIVE